MKRFVLLFGLVGCSHVLTFPSLPTLAAGDGSATINGALARWHVFGRGPILIVEPGGPGLSWEYLRMPELEKSLTVVYVEPVGSGDSGRLADPQGYTRARWTDDVEQLRKHLGLDTFYLLGHSYGGFVAQEYAIHYPGHLRGLILFATSPRTDDDFGAQTEANIKRFANEPWFKDAVAGLEAESQASTEEEGHTILRREIPLYVENYQARKQEIDQKVASLRFNPAAEHGTPSPFDVRPQLRSVHAPILVLSAEHDFICDPRFGREIRDAALSARMVVIPNANHMAHWDQPAAVARAIVDFVLGVEKSPPWAVYSRTRWPVDEAVF